MMCEQPENPHCCYAEKGQLTLTARKEDRMRTAMTGADLHVQAAASYFPQAYEKNSKSASAGRALKPAYSSIL